VISGIPKPRGNFCRHDWRQQRRGASTSQLDLEVIDTAALLHVKCGPASPVRASQISQSILWRRLPILWARWKASATSAKTMAKRIRGYLTAPVTGNYYFWLAANNAAELWISNDGEPVNKVRRAYVSKGTTPRQWTVQPNQRSPWLRWKQAGGITSRFFTRPPPERIIGRVGWLQDPTGTNTVPARGGSRFRLVALPRDARISRSRHLVFGEHAGPARCHELRRRLGDLAAQRR